MHCHVRDPETGAPSRRNDLYREVTERIRDAEVDVVLNLTAGMGGDMIFGNTEQPLPLNPNGTDYPLMQDILKKVHDAGQGSGPRDTGFSSTRGGQIKLNVTKEFDGGYVRIYGKYLDDRVPAFDLTPVGVTGTNSNPDFHNIGGYDARHDSLNSKYFQSLLTLDGNNNVVRDDMTAGQHPIVKSVGVESKFEVAGWDLTERFRYADMSNHYMGIYYTQFIPAALLPASPALAGAGGVTGRCGP